MVAGLLSQGDAADAAKFTAVTAGEALVRQQLAPPAGVIAPQAWVLGATGGVAWQSSRDLRSTAYLALEGSWEKAAGMRLAIVERKIPHLQMVHGLPSRDAEVEQFKRLLRDMAEAGLTVACYNWMPSEDWQRTSSTVRERGGALVTELLTDFDLTAAKAQGLTQWGEVPEEKIWQNIEYFLKAVIPVAEKAGVQMALHPDDPPLSPLRGIGRIVTSAANYRRILNLVPSPVNGITFCQANFIAMGEDCVQLVREWGRQKKIFFVHFRDIAGTREHFTETFHDEGQTDMVKMLKTYHEVGFKGPIRPDHAPTLDEETNDRPGYAIQGKIFAIGYMKGVMQGLGLPYA